MITIDLTFMELVTFVLAYMLGKVIGEVTVIMFREWNYRRSRSMR